MPRTLYSHIICRFDSLEIFRQLQHLLLSFIKLKSSSNMLKNYLFYLKGKESDLSFTGSLLEYLLAIARGGTEQNRGTDSVQVLPTHG